MKATRMQEMCKSCTNLWGKSTTKNSTKSGMLTMGVCQRNLYKLHTWRMRNMCVCVCVRACKIIASVSVFSVLWHADSEVGEWQGRGAAVFKNLNGDVCRFVFIEIATQTRCRRRRWRWSRCRRCLYLSTNDDNIYEHIYVYSVARY